MFNLVVLSGRITHDLELKYTPSNVAVCSFSIAVERKYKQGEERQADFIDIVAWRNTAEFVAKYFKKGEMIGIEGAIQTRTYTDNNGNKRKVFEIIANNVQFIETKKDNNSPTDIQKTAQSENFASQGAFTEVGDDDGDLPF